MKFLGKHYVGSIRAAFWVSGFVNGLLLGLIAGLLISSLIGGSGA